MTDITLLYDQTDPNGTLSKALLMVLRDSDIEWYWQVQRNCLQPSIHIAAQQWGARKTSEIGAFLRLPADMLNFSPLAA